MSQNKTENINWLKIRWLIALLGICLVMLGQDRINFQVPPDAPPLALGTWLTQQIHLGDPNIDQVLNGLPLLIAGGVLLAISLRGIPLLLPPYQISFQEHPLALRLLRSGWQWLLAGIGIYVIFILCLGSPGFNPFEVPVWLISLTLVTVSITFWDRNRKIDLSPHISRQDLLWIVGFLAAGVVIGAFRLQGLPDQLIGDEGNFWTIARDIALNVFKPSIFAPGVYSFPVFSSILQAWFLNVFGVSLWGWRFGSVLMGLITVIPLYLLAREMFDRKIAILSSIVLITSPYFIDFSRLGYNNIQALFFTTLTLYWLYIGLFRRSSLYLFLAGCMAGLCFYTYFAARIALVISVLFILSVWIAKKIKFTAVLHAAGAIGLGFVLVVSPYLIYGNRLDPQGLSYKSFESAFFNSFNGLQFYTRAELFSVAPPLEISGNELFYNPQIYAVLITRGFIRTMLAFQKSGLISEHYIAFPLAGTIGAVFFLFGFMLILLNFRQTRSLLLILWFFANVLGLSTLNTVPPRHTHMVAIIPALAILTAIGLNAIATAASAMHARLRNFGTVILFGLILLTATGGLYDYFIRVPEQYHPVPVEIISWATLESHNESIVYLYSDPSQKDFIPYSSRVFRSNVPYAAVPVEDVISGKKNFTSQPTLVFYSPDVATDVGAALQKQWGAAFRSTSFYSTDGDLVLLAGLNTPFVFEKDKELSTVIKDSFLIPSFDLLLVFILGVFLLVLFLPKSSAPGIPVSLQRLVEWVNAPGEPVRLEKPADLPDEILPVAPLREEPSNDPPDWILNINEPEQYKFTKHFRARFKSVITNDGADYYLHLHFPKFKLPFVRLPGLNQEVNASPELFFPSLNIPDPILLICGVLAAIAAQILISSQLYIFGILVYGISGFCLIFWVRINPRWKNVFSNQVQLTTSLEILASGLIFLVMVFTRFFDLNYRVYGLEADETKWTVQSWYSTILRVDLGEFATMHYKYLPVDFWVRSLFLRAFGLNFISARIESVVLSLISILFLYLLVRLLTSSPSIAILSTLLFGLSFVELNASHQALHNTPPEPWMIAALFFMFLGIRDRKVWQFQLTGLLLGLGMLTYETFYPTSVVAMVYLFGLAIYEVSKKKDTVRNWFTRLAIVSWPVVFVYFVFSRPYLAGRQGYLFGWLDYFSSSGHGLAGAASFMLVNARDVLISTFSHVVFTDSLINWIGPLINPLILPFVVMGLVYNLWNIRRPTYLFILLWYLMNTIMGPIILGSVWPRVMFLSLSPLMIWGALGLWLTFGALRSFFINRSFPIAVSAFILMILAIVLNDYHIFTTQLVDPVERQKRRELADLTYSSASSTRMILFPFIPNQNDALELESHVLIYSVAGARNLGLEAANYYRQLTQASLLPTLWQLKGTDGLDIFFDKTANSFQDVRLKLFQNILNCYPHTILKSSARFFDVYHLEPQDLASPRCFSPAAPAILTPKDYLVAVAGQPVIFKWDANNVKTGSFELTVERKLDNVFWIEAEDFQGPGWYPNDNFIYDYSGTGFLVDGDHAGQADYYNLTIPSAGQYNVWVRFYKRRRNDQHNFINIAGQQLEFADNNSALNEWVWKDMGSFDLNVGQLPLALTRTYGNDEEYSVFIDAIVVTSNLDYQPGGEDSEWQIIKSTGEINSNASEYQLDGDLLPGEYRWKIRVFDANRIVNAAGDRGIESDVAYFVVH